MDERKDKIIGFMKEDSYKPMLLKELGAIFGVPKEDGELFRELMKELEEEGKIFKNSKERYGLPQRMNLVVGRIQGNERGFGFLIPDDEDMKDVFISVEGLNGAMHNDRVVARVMSGTWGNKRAEGEVVRILTRANKTLVGTFDSSKYFGFVVPDNKRISTDVFISKDEVNGAKQGQKVVAEILKWPDSRRNAEGRIIEIIGDADAVGTDILSIIKSHNFLVEFPEEVIAQAEAIPDTVLEGLVEGRRDLRGLRMVTIDGEDAKDLDDAVSIQKLNGGIFRLGVHIADVSHYVTENSPLDKEALQRGTSVYLVDRVIPMLPKKLSNGICSLNPQVDRLAFTCMMDIDHTGRVVNHEIFESVIKTDERMTYTDVFKILEEKEPVLTERYQYLVEDFERMKELALILRKKRLDRGAVDFDFDEAKILLDDNGKPVEVKRYVLTIANKIIEEFMLVCNETVAEHFFWADAPFVYRIHEDPDTEKIEALNEFVHNFGYFIKGTNKIHPRALQDLLEKVKGKKEERIISTVMLRSMQKAKYSPECVGHFGLAAKYYCHFTSPIRRYPDLIIHRIMKESLKGLMKGDRETVMGERVHDIAKQCSERERAAEEAERETDDLKKVEFMKSREGEDFDGIISGVTSFGMFVELENTIEGLVKVSAMEDDYYVFDEKHYCLIGERTRKVYRLGDSVRVKLVRADISARQIEFFLVEDFDEEQARGAGEREIIPAGGMGGGYRAPGGTKIRKSKGNSAMPKTGHGKKDIAGYSRAKVKGGAGGQTSEKAASEAPRQDGFANQPHNKKKAKDSRVMAHIRGKAKARKDSKGKGRA